MRTFGSVSPRRSGSVQIWWPDLNLTMLAPSLVFTTRLRTTSVHFAVRSALSMAVVGGGGGGAPAAAAPVKGRGRQAAPAPPPPPPLRILALHGFVQNAAVFRERTGSLRKALRSSAELVFVDGPHDASGAFDEPGGESNAPADPRGWWLAGENAPSVGAQPPGGWTRPSLSLSARGVEGSLAVLRQTIAEQGPFDGVFGFSQGAAMAGLLLAAEPSAFSFAVLVAGFVAADPQLAATVAAASPLPQRVLSVGGEADAMVPLERVATLEACFQPERVTRWRHAGGHHIPSSAPFRAALAAFVEEQQRLLRHAETEPQLATSNRDGC